MADLTRPNPFVGPRPFERGQTLYGRDREVLDLLDLLIAERIVLLHSPSGAGKTSLICAQNGLIERLVNERFRVLPIIRVHSPETIDAPNCYLLSTMLSLEEAFGEEERLSTETLSELRFDEYLDRRFPSNDGAGPIVLIFDQFEEIISVNPADRSGTQEFFTQVGQALRNRQRWAIFALREEYVARLEIYQHPIPTRFANTFPLALLGPDAATAAIEGPADGGFSPRAVKGIVDDLRTVVEEDINGVQRSVKGEFVEPVQLQIVCRDLWQRNRPTENRPIGLRTVTQIETNRALRRYYAEEVGQISDEFDVSERALRDWFGNQLIQNGIRAQVRHGPKKSDGGYQDEVLVALVDAHTVRAETRRGATWIELAHDRLIGPVVNDNEAWRVANLSALQRRAEVWANQGRPKGLLFQDAELSEAESWAAAHEEEITDVEAAFLNACREERRRIERQRRYQQLVVLLAVVATLAAIVAWGKWQDAEEARNAADKEARSARASELTVHAREQFDRYARYTKAPILLGDAISTTFGVDGSMPDGAADLVVAHLDAMALPDMTLPPGHDGEITSASSSYDGRLIVTTGQEGTAKVWDTNTGQVLDTFVGHAEVMKSAAFSPVDNRIVTAGEDHIAIVWSDEEDRQERLRLAHRDIVNSAQFSPDGERVVTASNDRTAKVWDATSGKLLATLIHQEWVKNATFSPDGQLIVTSACGSQTTFRNAETYESVGEPLRTEAYCFQSAMVSPNGRQVLTVDNDGKATVQPVPGADGDVQRIGPQSIQNQIDAARFSPDGSQILTSDLSGSLAIWDVDSPGRPMLLVVGEPDEIAVSWLKDGHILTRSKYTVHVRSSENLSVTMQYPTHTVVLTRALFTPDGTGVLTTDGNGKMQYYDAQTGEREWMLDGDGSDIASAHFSPDGMRLVTVGSDGVRIWHMDSGDDIEHVSLVNEPDVLFRSAVFANDSQHVVTTSDDGRVRIWDANTREEVSFPISDRVDVVYASFSPDGDSIVTSTMLRAIQVWDRFSGTALTQELPTESTASTTVFSPDGNQILISGGRSAGIWNWRSGVEQRSLSGHAGWISSAQYSSDGSLVVTAGDDGTVRIWDATTGTERWVLGTSLPAAHWAEFYPGSTDKVIAAYDDRKARIWDLGVANDLVSFGDPDQPFLRAAISPDGSQIATNDRSITLWNAQTGAKIRSLSQHEGPVTALDFSPDSDQVVTASEDGAVRLWTLDKTGHLTTTRLLGFHDGPVESVQFAANRRYAVSAGADGVAKIWTLYRQSEPIVLSGHNTWLHTAAFSPDNATVVTGGDDGKIALWNASSGQQLLPPQDAHAEPLIRSDFFDDGAALFTAGTDGVIKLWDVSSMTTTLSLTHTTPIASAAISADGKQIVVGDRDGFVSLYLVDPDVDITRSISIEVSLSSISTINFSSDGERIVTGGEDGVVRVWSLAPGRKPTRPDCSLRHHTEGINAVSFAPNSDFVLSGSNDQTIQVWSMGRCPPLSDADQKAQTEETEIDTTHQPVGSSFGHTEEITWIAYSHNGSKVVTASEDGSAKIWAVETGDLLLTLRGHEGALTSALFSSNGDRLVTASEDQTAIIWNAVTGEEICRAVGEHTLQIWYAEFSPKDDRIVTASSDRTAIVWDADDCTPQRTLKGHHDYVQSASFSGDGRLIVTASADDSARVWNAFTGKQLRPFEDHDDDVIFASFSPIEPDHVLTVGGDGAVKVWDTEIGKVYSMGGAQSQYRFYFAAYSPDGNHIVAVGNDAEGEYIGRIWPASPEHWIERINETVQESGARLFKNDRKVYGYE